MKIIQLKTTEKHTDLDQFVKTLYRTDSNFEYNLLFTDKVEISLKPRFFSFIRGGQSPAVNFVTAVVDDRTLYTLNPIIEVRPSFYYEVLRRGTLILCGIIAIAALLL